MNKRSGSESKRRILNSAVKVFSEYGYKGASMRIIARAAGIGVGTLYLYFESKEDLYATLITKRLEDLTDRTKRLLKDIKEPEKALTAFIAMRLDYAKKHKELILIQAREYGLGLAVKSQKTFLRQQRKTVEEIIRRGTASGTFRKCNAAEVAKIIICLLRGFIISIIIEPGALFSAEECGNVILEGLLSEKSSRR